MPNIATYDTPNLGINPSEVGAEAYAQTGRRIGAAYSDIAEEQKRSATMLGNALQSGIDTAGKAYDEAETHREIMTGGALSSTLALNLDQAWNRTIRGADPNDPSTALKFREEVLEPALTDFAGHFTTERGQNFAESQMNNLREHMSRKMVADQSSAAADAVTVNIQQTANSLSNMAYKDPTSVDFALQTVDHSLGHMVDSSPSITPDVAAHVKAQVGQEMKEKIVKAAVQGAIERNPASGLAMSQDPKYAPYVNGAEVGAFAKEVDRQNKIDATNARIMANDQRRETSEATYDKAILALHDPDPDKRPTLQQLRQIPGNMITPEHREQLFNYVEKEANREEIKPKAVYQQGLTDTLTDIWRPQGDPQKITQLSELQKRLSDGVLDYQGYKQAQAELLSPRDDENGLTLQQNRQRAFQRAVVELNPPDSAMQRHPQGYARVDNAYMRLGQLEKLAREKAGDPNSVYDPTSPYYYGKDAAFRAPSPWLIEQEANQNLKAQGVPDKATPPVAPPKPTYKLGDRVPRKGGGFYTLTEHGWEAQ